MKRIIIILLALLMVFALFSCEKKEAPPEAPAVPDDFSFYYSWGCLYDASFYDSETGELIKTKCAEDPDNYVTTFVLSDDNKQKVWELISALDVDSYPDEYDPDNGYVIPPSTFVLTVRANGAEKTIKAENNSGTFVSKNEKGQAFLDVCKYLSDMLTSSEEWKALPYYITPCD